jgi:hypothetical protein
VVVKIALKNGIQCNERSVLAASLRESFFSGM